MYVVHQAIVHVSYSMSLLTKQENLQCDVQADARDLYVQYRHPVFAPVMSI